MVKLRDICVDKDQNVSNHFTWTPRPTVIDYQYGSAVDFQLHQVLILRQDFLECCQNIAQYDMYHFLSFEECWLQDFERWLQDFQPQQQQQNGKQVKNLPNPNPCVVLFFGIDQLGHSITARITDATFELPLYIGISSEDQRNFWDDDCIDNFCRTIEQRYHIEEGLVSGRFETKYCLIGGWEPKVDSRVPLRQQDLREQQTHDFIYLSLPNPWIVVTVANWLHYNKNIYIKSIDSEISLTPYEFDRRDFDAKTLLLEKLGLINSGWVTIQKTRKPRYFISHDQIEFECSVKDIERIQKKEDMAPLLLLGFDIEELSLDGSFPRPKEIENHVFCINSALHEVGNKKDVIIRKACHYFLIKDIDSKRGELVLFNENNSKDLYVLQQFKHALKQRRPDIDDIFFFTLEKDLFKHWRDYITVILNVDDIAAYNGYGYDLHANYERSELLKADTYLFLSKLIKYPCELESLGFKSRQKRRREMHTYRVLPGMTVMDPYFTICDTKKLKRFDLNFVASKFIGEQKKDMPHDELRRRRLLLLPTGPYNDITVSGLLWKEFYNEPHPIIIPDHIFDLEPFGVLHDILGVSNFTKVDMRFFVYNLDTKNDNQTLTLIASNVVFSGKTFLINLLEENIIEQQDFILLAYNNTLLNHVELQQIKEEIFSIEEVLEFMKNSQNTVRYMAKMKRGDICGIFGKRDHNKPSQEVFKNLLDLYHIHEIEYRCEETLDVPEIEALIETSQDFILRVLPTTMVKFISQTQFIIESSVDIADYCQTDADLVVKLMNALMHVINLIMTSRNTNANQQDILYSGQQILVWSLLSRFSHKDNFVINKPKSEYNPNNNALEKEDDEYVGATVLSPITGYWDAPIPTLDFEGLYPSIIVDNNLCYSTQVLSDKYKNLPNIPYERIYIENNQNLHSYVQHKQGVLPKIVLSLKKKRRATKKLMGEEKDSFRKTVLNERQLAIKLIANSVYGFTGASVGKLPNKAIGEDITCRGRQMIDFTKLSVERWNGFDKDGNYTSIPGYEKLTWEQYKQSTLPGSNVQYNSPKLTDRKATVLYGDTDSVMVLFHSVLAHLKDYPDDMVEAFRMSFELGEAMAKHITSTFQRRYHQIKDFKAINLEHEKVYYPYLLIGKKKYAAVMFLAPPQGQEMQYNDIYNKEKLTIDNKGIECVRRDQAEITQDIMNKLLYNIMINRNVPLACRDLSDHLIAIEKDEYDVFKYDLSKSINGPYDHEEHPHLYVRNKIAQRMPGAEPKEGERVHFVYTTAPHEKIYQMAEDPHWAKNHMKFDNSCRINRHHYVANQIQGAICRILDQCIDPSPKCLFDKSCAILQAQQNNLCTLNNTSIRENNRETEFVINEDQTFLINGTKFKQKNTHELLIRHNKNSDKTVFDMATGKLALASSLPDYYKNQNQLAKNKALQKRKEKNLRKKRKLQSEKTQMTLFECSQPNKKQKKI